MGTNLRLLLVCAFLLPGTASAFDSRQQCWMMLGCEHPLCSQYGCANSTYCQCRDETPPPPQPGSIEFCYYFPWLCQDPVPPPEPPTPQEHPSYQCQAGYACDGSMVTGVPGDRICGADRIEWSCEWMPSGTSVAWVALNTPCQCEDPNDTNYSCEGGTRCDGTPITGSPGQEVCGTNLLSYTCTRGGWAAGGSCECANPECPNGPNGTPGCPFRAEQSCPDGGNGTQECPYPPADEPQPAPTPTPQFEWGLIPRSNFPAMFQRIYPKVLQKLSDPGCNASASSATRSARDTLEMLFAQNRIRLDGGNTGICGRATAYYQPGSPGTAGEYIHLCDTFFGGRYADGSSDRYYTDVNFTMRVLIHEVAHATGALNHSPQLTGAEATVLDQRYVDACGLNGRQWILDLQSHSGPIATNQTLVPADRLVHLLEGLFMSTAHATAVTTPPAVVVEAAESRDPHYCGTEPVAADLSKDFFQVTKTNTIQFDFVGCPGDSTFTGCSTTCSHGSGGGSYPVPHYNGCHGSCWEPGPVTITAYCARKKVGREIKVSLLDNVERGAIAACESGTTVVGCTGYCANYGPGGSRFSGNGCELICDYAGGGGRIAAHCIQDSALTIQHLFQGLPSGSTLSCPAGSRLAGGATYCDNGRGNLSEVNGNGIRSTCPSGVITAIGLGCVR